MLKKFVLSVAALTLLAAPALAAPEIGKPAPDFTATDVHGQPFKLADQKGKTVVLEWTNSKCPFVIKHYETGNMQKLQKDATEKGVVWVTINSSAPGRQGHVSNAEAIKIMQQAGAAQTVQILDESGEVGKAYGASTTPHMFVIDAEGTLVYMGAIDDNSSPKHETVEGAKNYVAAALASLEAGQPVETAVSQPYGCSVKYAE